MQQGRHSSPDLMSDFDFDHTVGSIYKYLITPQSHKINIISQLVDNCIDIIHNLFTKKQRLMWILHTFIILMLRVFRDSTTIGLKG